MKQLTLAEAKKILVEVRPLLTEKRESRINPGITQFFVWNTLMQIVEGHEREGGIEKSPTWHITARNIWNEFGKPKSSYSKLKQENATLRIRVAELESELQGTRKVI